MGNTLLFLGAPGSILISFVRQSLYYYHPSRRRIRTGCSSMGERRACLGISDRSYAYCSISDSFQIVR